jgi:hypothetical protein
MSAAVTNGIAGSFVPSIPATCSGSQFDVNASGAAGFSTISVPDHPNEVHLLTPPPFERLEKLAIDCKEFFGFSEISVSERNLAD